MVKINHYYIITKVIFLFFVFSSVSNAAAETLYQRNITIGNPGGKQLTDYQIVINVDTASLIDRGVMRPDCGDFRFYDNDAQTELSYWLESGCNTANTKVWVKVPIIPVGGKTIYLAYGNNGFTSQSNGDATFVFFDDFTGSSVNSEKWNVETYPDTSITVGDSVVSFCTTNRPTANRYPGINAISGLSFYPNMRVYAKLKYTDLTGWPITSLQFDFGSGNKMYWQLQQYFGEELWGYYKNAPQNCYATTSTLTGWHTWEILKYNNNNYVWKRNGAVIKTVSDSYWNAFNSFQTIIANGFYPNSPANQCHEWDFIIFANYASPEPTVSVGSETPTITTTIPTTTTTMQPTTTTTVPPADQCADQYPSGKPHILYTGSNLNCPFSDWGLVNYFQHIVPFPADIQNIEYYATVDLNGATGCIDLRVVIENNYGAAQYFNGVTDGQSITINVPRTYFENTNFDGCSSNWFVHTADLGWQFQQCGGGWLGDNIISSPLPGCNLNLNTCCPGSTCCTPTAITLSTFEVSPGNGSVTLSWTTETEIDNAGFNIYRAASENGEYVKINAAIIPAKAGAAQGAFYQFIDNNVGNRKTYYYKLEDIDLSGKSTMHGPVSAMPRLMFGFRD